MAALLVALSEVGAAYETVTTLSLFTTLARFRVTVEPLTLLLATVTGLPSTLTVNAVVAAVVAPRASSNVRTSEVPFALRTAPLDAVSTGPTKSTARLNVAASFPFKS